MKTTTQHTDELTLAWAADVNRLGYVGKLPGSKARDSDSWFTPAKYIESVRAVLGRIDLDPFSSEVANRTVGAKSYFSERDDAFKQSWTAGTVFMNPPYGGKMVRASVEKFVSEFSLEHFTSGIVLVNNSTETVFFQLLLKRSDSVCFTNHRISFYNSDGKRISGNTRGQAFFYFGVNRNLFRKEFSQFGCVL